MALLIGLGISFAVGALVYVGYEDEIDEARQLAEENGIDPDNFDVSDISDLLDERNAEAAQDRQDAAPQPVDEVGGEDAQAPSTQTFASAQTPAEPRVEFEPDHEQIVVDVDPEVDLAAPATNIYDPGSDTTTLTIGDTALLQMAVDKTDVSIGFGTPSETQSGLSPFDITLYQNRLQTA